MVDKMIKIFYSILRSLLILVYVFIVGCDNEPVPSELHRNFISYDSPQILEGLDYLVTYSVEKAKSDMSPWYKEETYKLSIQGYKEYRLTFLNDKLYSILLEPNDMEECKKLISRKRIKIIIQKSYCIIMDIKLGEEMDYYISNHA